MTQPDNRMGWIRNFSKIVEEGAETYYTEYELVSECHISSVLDYNNEAILCGGMTFEGDLKHYLLKIKYKAFPEHNQNAMRDGYYFEGGIADELVSLMSLFLQCRFYQVAIYQGELSPHGLRSKYELPFLYKKCNPLIHATIFEQDSLARRFVDMVAFLDQVQTLNPKYHHSFALAVRQYSIALRNIGVDEEMVFIRLVSAVEALSKHTDLDPEEDPLAGKTLEEIIVKEQQNAQTMDAIRNIFNTRKAALKFRKFIKKYMGDILPADPPMEGRGSKWITKANLDEVLQRIYKARSKYLHEGQLMYLSQHMRGIVGDFDPSVGMTIDNHEFKEDEQLPLTSPFENLVRQCLINFVAANQI